jgi:hypothetical protein
MFIFSPLLIPNYIRESRIVKNRWAKLSRLRCCSFPGNCRVECGSKILTYPQ